MSIASLFAVITISDASIMPWSGAMQLRGVTFASSDSVVSAVNVVVWLRWWQLGPLPKASDPPRLEVDVQGLGIYHLNNSDAYGKLRKLAQMQNAARKIESISAAEDAGNASGEQSGNGTHPKVASIVGVVSGTNVIENAGFGHGNGPAPVPVAGSTQSSRHAPLESSGTVGSESATATARRTRRPETLDSLSKVDGRAQQSLGKTA